MMESINTIKISLTHADCSMLQDYIKIEKFKVMIVSVTKKHNKKDIENKSVQPLCRCTKLYNTNFMLCKISEKGKIP